MLQKERDFLKKLADRAKFSETNNVVCLHRHEAARLSIEREFIFFEPTLSKEQKEQLFKEIEDSLERLSRCSCKHTENDLRAKGVYEEYTNASNRDDVVTLERILQSL